MKLSQIVLLSLSVVLMVIGVDQTMNYGIQNSYFIFMFTIAVLLYYFYKKRQQEEAADDELSKKNKK